MKKILLPVLLLFPFLLQAQVTVSGIVKDGEDKSPLPYVNIYVKNTTQGTYTDVKGNFSIHLSQNEAILVFSFIGYEKKEISVKGNQNLTVVLKPLTLSLDEITVMPGENPADVIMRKVVDNRDAHDPENLETFKFKSYNKFTVGIDASSKKGVADSVPAPPKKYTNPGDSILDAKEHGFEDTLLNKMNLFLMESVTEKKYKKPRSYKETVLASRMSGVKSAEYVLLATEIQSFSFYSNYIKVLGKEYLSPIAQGNTRKYLFILQDTADEKGEQAFVIYYQPRKGKNFEGLTGLLYINTQNFAVMKATASVAGSDGTETQVVQYYSKLGEDVYFPTLFTSDFYFSSVAVSLSDSGENARSFAPIGKARTTLYDISLENDFKRREFDNVELEFAPDALKKDKEFWNTNRQDSLDAKDSLTYTLIDSIGKELNLDRRLEFLRIFSTGKIPVGFFNIHLDEIARFNNFEGLRAGLGVSTNNRLSKRFTVGGYYAYGFKDVHSKYGGNFSLYLNKTQTSALNTLYSNDVDETGVQKFVKYTLADPERFRDIYVSVMDRVERSKATLNFRLLRYVTINGGMELVNKKVTTQYRYGDGQQDYFKFTNAILTLRWAPGEKLVQSFGTFRPINNDRSFVLNGHISKSVKSMANGQFDFLRTDISADYKFRIRNFGHTYIRLSGGHVEGDAPYTEMYFGKAGYNTKNIALVTPYAFETMKYNEFFGNSYGAAFIRHDFGSLLFKSKKLKPQILLVTNVFFSRLSNPNIHKNYPLNTATKGFYESGVQINNIYKINFAGYGVGVFYRYGPYSNSEPLKNLIVKLSINAAF